MNDVIEQDTLPEPTLREELAKNLQAADESGQFQEEATETEKEKATPERDEKGRFEEKAAENQRLQRPSSWKKEYWEKWDKISGEDPELAKYLQERESQFASGVSTYKQEWEQAKPLIDAIAPFQPILQQNGVDPAQWISNLGNAHHALALGAPQEKLAMFQRLMADYRVPAQLAIQGSDGNWQLLGQSQPQQPQFDPSVIPRLVQQEMQTASTKQVLESFIREAPLKYPHFEVVKQTMAGLLQAGLADDLPSAYEAALRHPRHADLFESLQRQQREQQETQAREAQKQKVQRAKSNAISTSSATPSGQMNAAEEKGLRDQLTENFRAVVGGRV